MVAIAGHLRSLGFRRLSFLAAGWEDRTDIGWTDKDLEALDRAREAFFPFFLESARRGDPEVDMGFAALVASEPEGPAGLCECGSGEVFIDTRARLHRCPQLYAAGFLGIAAGSKDAGNVDEDCRDCWAYPRCRGGCVVRNQRCPWIPRPLSPHRKTAWCDLLRAEFARAALAYRILEARRG